MTNAYRIKELSWLAFNERVLQEAASPNVPVVERMKFLGIYSNNLDEFFRVRVATLKRLTYIKKADKIIGEDPKNILKEINEIVLEQRTRFDLIYNSIKNDLEKENIFLVNEKTLNDKQKQFVNKYFHDEVRTKLIPVMLDQTESFPDLEDDAIYYAVSLENTNNDQVQYALIHLPTKILDRFIILPKEGEKQYIILLDDVIRFELSEIFYIFDYDKINAYTIKLTKDAELDINDDFSESYVKKISQSIERRKEGEPIRFVFDADIPTDLLNYLIKSLKFGKDDALIPGGRYHNFKDFIKFPDLGMKHLRYKDFPPIPHKDIKPRVKILSQIREKDILLNFPYHSFDNFIDLLREAAIDPKVRSIKITLYRLGQKSSVINALINATRNGKQVTAVVELTARFDEQANIKWSNRLRDHGVKVIYGVQDLKVHAKLVLIERREKKRTVFYSCIGTGNFNEDTTSIFSDHLLLTSDKRLTSEVVKVFDFFEKNYKISLFRHLIVSPFYMRNKLTKLINNEIKNAREGKKAFIYIKMNNVVDERIIYKLYEASQVGVDVRMNVRGMFSMVPGLPGISEKIESVAMIDRFLEHTRLMIFHNNGWELFYISSADLMTRNLDRRVEVACPIYDPDLQKELKDFFEIQWKDNTQMRILDRNLENKYRQKNQGDESIRSQYAWYEYMKKGS